jgi:hypothetical protein
MPNLKNILQNSLFHHVKKKFENIFSQKFGFYFQNYFFADPAPGLWYLFISPPPLKISKNHDQKQSHNCMTDSGKMTHLSLWTFRA